jgi:hypothetical protein
LRSPRGSSGVAAASSAVARSTGLDRLRFVRGQMDVVAAAEGDAARLIAQRGRLARAFAAGVAANLLVLVSITCSSRRSACRRGRSPCGGRLRDRRGALAPDSGGGGRARDAVMLFRSRHPAEVGLAVGSRSASASSSGSFRASST